MVHRKVSSHGKRLQADPDHDSKVEEHLDDGSELKRKRLAEEVKPAPTLAAIRAPFDGVIGQFPAAEHHLIASPADGTGKTVLISPKFESGIVKVLRSEEKKLTAGEIESLKRFERCVGVPREEGDIIVCRFAEKCEGAAKKKPSTYINLDWILGTSNEVERLFSREGLVLTERRQRMYPSTVEKLLMLEYNHKLLDVYTVAAALCK